MPNDSQHADGIVISMYLNGELISRPVLKWPKDDYPLSLFNAMIDEITAEIKKQAAVVASDESYDSRPAISQG